MNDRTGWLRNGIRPLILATMLAIMGWALVQLSALFAPGWDGRYVPLLLTILVAEVYLSHQFLRTRQLRGGDVLHYRLAEALLLFFVARLLPFFLSTSADRWQEPRTWIAHPELIITHGETWIVYIAMLLFWQSIHGTLQDFAKVDGPVREEGSGYSLTAVIKDRLALQQDQMETALAHRSLFDRFLQGGLLLLVITGLSVVGVRSLTDFRRPPVTGDYWAVGLYFLCGLLMTGLLRYVALRRKWQVDRVTVDPGVAEGWLFYLAFLLLLGAVAALALPTGYSLPFLGTVARVLEQLFSILAFVGLLLFVIITFPVVWGAWFLSTLFGNPSAAPRFSPPSPPPLAAPLAEGINWIEFIRAAGLWLLLLALLWYAVRTYWRDKSLPGQYRTLTTLRARIAEWVARLLSWFTARQRQMAEAIRQRIGAGRGTAVNRRNRRAAKSAGPLISLYLRLIRRALEGGVIRQESDTPFEFDSVLKQRFPEVHEELDQLTEAFVEARYSRHVVTPDTVAKSRSSWHRIRGVIKRSPRV